MALDPHSGLSPLDYGRAVDIIACVVFSLCHHADGTPTYTHYSENNLNAPCDMLARLGLMSGLPRGAAHQFPVWFPGESLPIIRHPGEPVAADLLLALAFYAQWFPHDSTYREPEANEPMPEADLTADNRWSEQRERFKVWSVRRVARLLAELNLGGWNSEGTFRLPAPFGDVLDIEYYWYSRSRVVGKFGGNEGALYPLD